MNHSQDDGPAPARPPGRLDRALALVEFLRSACAWDAAQTPRSLRRHLLEEAHEVVDAIERGEEGELRDELGDLLLNLAFQIVLAEERTAFGREDVVSALEEKMRRRHPHLYEGTEPVPWEVLKARERAQNDPGEHTGTKAIGSPAEHGGGLLRHLLPGGEPMRRAQSMQERVATIGFDWAEPEGALDKVIEEVEEVRAEIRAGRRQELEVEIGDLIFSVVNLSRLCGVDAPTALVRANRKFARRFAALEALAAERGVLLSEAGLELLDDLWTEAKRAEE